MLLIKAIRKADRHPVGAWDAAKHPRDAHGRFIEVGHHVTLKDGTTGTVIRAVSARTVDVRTADGKTVRVAANTVSSGEPGKGAGGLAGMKFPKDRKLTVTHGPHDTPVIGHVTSHSDHLAVEPVKGGISHRIPHTAVNRIIEAPGHEDRPGAVRYVRRGYQPGRPASRPEPAAAAQVRARELQPGDRTMIPHPQTGEAAPAAVLANEPRGDSAELEVRHGDGTESYYLTDRSAWVDKLGDDPFPGETAVTPDPAVLPPLAVRPLPDGTAVARPVLYTYQRNKITSLNLDRDRTLPAEVSQAAARIRQRQPLSAQQAGALARVLRDRAAAHPSPVQRRSLERTAYRLDAAAAEAHGIKLPAPQVTGRRAIPVTPDGITEGDHVIVAGADGNLTPARVRSITPLMGGRLALADLEHDDGTTETRTITAKTRVWLIPDRPDDVPIPPPGLQREHITPDRLRPGDTIRVAPWQGDASRNATVTAVKSAGADGAAATLPDGGTFTYTSEDGGPAIIRTARGEASQDQPWDSPLPEGNPVTIGVQDVKAGDRIHVDPGRETSLVGTVQTVTHSPGLTQLTLRGDDSETQELEFEHDQHPTVTRLAEADSNAEARIAEQKRTRETEQASRAVSDAIGGILSELSARDAVTAMSGSGSPQDELEEEIRRIPAADLAPMYVQRTANLGSVLYPGGEPGTADARKETLARVMPLIAELAERNRTALIESLRNAVAGFSAAQLADPHETGDPAGKIMRERRRVIEQLRDSPPPRPPGQVARLLAEAVAAARKAGTGTSPSEPDVPELPPGTDLTARMRAYRAALPADAAHIGKTSVSRAMIVAPRLADLEAGKAPAIEQVVTAVPDRAADGGPGAIAMRHLDIVMAAGRDLDAELQQAIRAGGAEPESPGDASARAAKIRDLSQRRLAALQQARTLATAAQDTFAKEHGFGSLYHLTRLQAKAHYGGQREEAQRLQALMDEATRAGRNASTAHDTEAASLGQQAAALREEAKTVNLTSADTLRNAALGVLRKVRPDGLGGTGAQYNAATGKRQQLTERSELVQAMRWAEQHYPAGWLAKYRAHAPRGYSLGTVQRGHYSNAKREIRLSKGAEKATGAGERGDVAIHEAGHAMERAVPGLLALEDAYLWSRSSQGSVGSRTREKKGMLSAGEYAYKDDFPEPYSGKDYAGRKDAQSDAYELLTTGVQSLFGGYTYLDPSFRQWLLGTLALVD